MSGSSENLSNVGHIQFKLRSVDVVNDVFETFSRDTSDLNHLMFNFAPAHVAEKRFEIRTGSSKDSSVGRKGLVVGHQSHIAKKVLIAQLVEARKKLGVVLCFLEELKFGRFLDFLDWRNGGGRRS